MCECLVCVCMYCVCVCVGGVHGVCVWGIFVLNLFPVCLYRGTLVEIFELKHRREYHFLQEKENKQQFMLMEVHNYRHTQMDAQVG